MAQLIVCGAYLQTVAIFRSQISAMCIILPAPEGPCILGTSCIFRWCGRSITHPKSIVCRGQRGTWILLHIITFTPNQCFGTAQGLISGSLPCPQGPGFLTLVRSGHRPSHKGVRIERRHRVGVEELPSTKENN